jgi:hypothetical protein
LRPVTFLPASKHCGSIHESLFELPWHSGNRSLNHPDHSFSDRRAASDQRSPFSRLDKVALACQNLPRREAGAGRYRHNPCAPAEGSRRALRKSTRGCKSPRPACAALCSNRQKIYERSPPTFGAWSKSAESRRYRKLIFHCGFFPPRIPPVGPVPNNFPLLQPPKVGAHGELFKVGVN